jgi:hypothetical protein
MNLHRFLMLTALAALGSSLPAATIAYQAADWSYSGNCTGTCSVAVDASSTVVTFSYVLSGEDIWTTQTWSLLTTATADDQITINWDYSGYHSFFEVSAFLNSLVGSNTTTLVSEGPEDCCTSPSGGFHYTGTTTISVSAGQLYGFSMGGSNKDRDQILSGTLSLSASDSAPASTPEPASALLIPAGLAALASFRQYRKRCAARS